MKYVVVANTYTTEYIYRIYGGEIQSEAKSTVEIQINEFVAGVIHKSDMGNPVWVSNSNIFNTKKEAISACIKMIAKLVTDFNDIDIIRGYDRFFHFIFRNGSPPISNWPKLIEDLENLGW